MKSPFVLVKSQSSLMKSPVLLGQTQTCQAATRSMAMQPDPSEIEWERLRRVQQSRLGYSTPAEKMQKSCGNLLFMGPGSWSHTSQHLFEDYSIFGNMP